MKRKLSLCAILLTSCATSNDQDESLQKISLVDQHGLMQIISTKEELKPFYNVDFLTSQPYQYVTRVFREAGGKKKMTLTAYYSTGRIKEYLEAVDGRANGKYIYYFENGRKKIEGTIIGGLADLSEKAKASFIFDGPAKAFDIDGNIEALLTYEQGKLHGKSEYYFPNGNLKHTYQYHENKKHGIQYSYFQNGSLQSKKQYMNDQIDGICQEYYENKQKKNMELWVKGLIRRGHYFDRTGGLTSMIQDGNGIKTELHDEGRIETTFVNGKIDGKMTTYNKQGAIQTFSHQKNGKKHGEERHFYCAPFSKESKPKMSLFYVQDVLQGPAIVWYESGNVQVQYEMSENEKHGIATGFYEDGKVMYVENFNHGKLIEGKYYKKGVEKPVTEVFDGSGTATIFDPFGNIEKQVVYEKGEAVVS